MWNPGKVDEFQESTPTANYMKIILIALTDEALNVLVLPVRYTGLSSGALDGAEKHSHCHGKADRAGDGDEEQDRHVVVDAHSPEYSSTSSRGQSVVDVLG